MKLFIKKSEFKFIGDKVKDGSLIISNHVGTSAPLALELYSDMSFRFWGAYQMNSNVFKLYGYLSKTYYHEKKHWNLFGARMFCIIAAPLTWIFYRGLRLISTYKDAKFRKTIKESVETIKNNQSVVVFPEDSAKGYLDELEGIYAGFLVFAKTCYKEGIDVPIHCAYYNKEKKVYLFDKPIMYSELIKSGKSQQEMANDMMKRINELGNITRK
jgi:hypothetical protein